MISRYYIHSAHVLVTVAQCQCVEQFIEEWRESVRHLNFIIKKLVLILKGKVIISNTVLNMDNSKHKIEKAIER